MSALGFVFLGVFPGPDVYLLKNNGSYRFFKTISTGAIFNEIDKYRPGN
jgi:hypothetical protein